ncbi:RNA-binding protein FUS-like [Melanaphis sacchari]|uniref:RNA-binding protein FUS-like n=1 Tax=Melanaphis sacchari TaxID=742174 RepID=UPI000DC13CF9|nr:RNA-binding protein FUS-like [Melanaphis sacchari]
MGKATGVFVFCVAAVAMIAISEVPIATEAFLEPFASHLIAKKMILKHGLAAPPAAATGQTQYIYYGGQYQHQPQPRPSPPQLSVSYLAYGPQTTSYPAYGPQTSSYPSYGPQTSSSYPSYGQQTNGYSAYGQASYSGYNEQVAPVVKPASPPSGCPPASQPSTQVDYSNYAVHGGHGFGSYGNNGGYGK